MRPSLTLLRSVTATLLLGVAVSSPMLVAAKADGVATLVSSKGNVTFRRTTDPADRWSAVFPELRNKLLDHVKTGPESVATLEFDIGGRVGVNTNSEIEIVSQRKVEAVDQGMVETIIVNAGGIWAKIDQGQSTQLQVQTSGGVMGIKGTEFTVETDENGNSKLTVLEGSVELTPESGEPVLVQPGDVISFLRTGITERVRRPLEDLRSQLQGRFSALPVQWLDLKVPIPQFRNLDIAVELEPLARAEEAMKEAADRADDAAARAGDAASRVDAALARLPAGLGGRGGGPAGPAGGPAGQRERPRLDFPTDLQPYQVGIGTDCPVLRWSAFDKATRYAVLMARDERMTDLVWAARPNEPVAAYPANGVPLAAGRYYWRVIPLGENNRPVGKASQSWFDSTGWSPAPAQ